MTLEEAAERLKRNSGPSETLQAAVAHLADDGPLRWTVGTREEYLERSHELLVALVRKLQSEK